MNEAIVSEGVTRAMKTKAESEDSRWLEYDMN